MAGVNELNSMLGLSSVYLLYTHTLHKEGARKFLRFTNRIPYTYRCCDLYVSSIAWYTTCNKNPRLVLCNVRTATLYMRTQCHHVILYYYINIHTYKHVVYIYTFYVYATHYILFISTILFIHS